MKKLSAWLSDFDGHTALCVELAKPEFEKETGVEWPVYCTGTKAKVLLREGKKNYKGLQVWNGDPEHHVLGGWQLASALADKYAKCFSAHSIGRGSAFAECVDALRKAGR